MDKIPGRWFAVVAAVLLVGGCGEALLNLTASLGGATPGSRGEIGVIVLNNTPYQAVMTLGSYDQVSDAEPDVRQFTLSGAARLQPNSAGPLLTFDCARVFSIGGARLLESIESAGVADLSPEALLEGVAFFEVDPSDPAAQPVSRGDAAAFEVLLGVDFPCNSLLIFKLETNGTDPQSFRIDYELIPSSDTR